MKRRYMILGVLIVAAGALGTWWWRPRAAREPSTLKGPAATAPARRPAARAAPAAPPAELPIATDDDPPGALRLEGQVIDADERPVAGATVLVSSNPRRQLRTEADGSFAFDRLVAHAYTVDARKDGAHGGPVTVRLTARTEPVVLQLKEAGGLEVTVVALDDRKPVAGATVALHDEAVGEATTGADGKAVLRGVTSGWHLVEVEAAGFAPEAAVVEGASHPGATQRTTVELKRGAAASGKVVDPAGKPVAGAHVRAAASASFTDFAPSALADRSSDAAGRWSFPALPAGTFRFTAKHGKHGPGSSPPITLDGKTERKDIVVALEDGARVSGKVVRKDGTPVAAAAVKVAPRDAGFNLEVTRQAFSDDKGNFELSGLPRRPAQLYASDESASSELVPLDLAARPEQTGLTVVLDVTGEIAGIVVDAKGQTVAEAQVSAVPEPGSRRDDLSSWRLRGRARDVSDAGGRFALRGLPDGGYRVRASRADAGPMSWWQRPGVTAQVGDRNVRLILEDDGRIKGKVLFADGSPPDSYAVATGLGAGTSFANPDGGFEIEAPAGAAVLTVSGPQLVLKVVPDVMVKAGDLVDVGTITVDRGRSISGRVLGVDGAPVAGARVMGGARLLGNGSELSAGGLFSGMTGAKATTSGDDGSYLLASVGERSLVIAADHADGRSSVYRVPAGTSSVQLDLPLRPLGALEGRVTKAGQPLASAMVMAQPQQASRGTFMVTAGSDGAYRFDKLSPDGYLLSTLEAGGGGRTSLQTQLVTVEAGQTAHLDLDVPVGSVTVSVVMSAPPDVHTAQVFLATGTLSGGTAEQLGEAIAARGAGSAAMGFILKDQPAQLEHVAPGSYSACLIPVPGDFTSAADMLKLRDKADKLIAVCKPATIAEAPPTQTLTIPVPAVPPM